jgi:hypothetical protein
LFVHLKRAKDTVLSASINRIRRDGHDVEVRGLGLLMRACLPIYHYSTAVESEVLERLLLHETVFKSQYTSWGQYRLQHL